jgi:L-threonylcarbamoyladenylate synthase
VALALLEAFEKAGGKGVAAPSANRFGHVSPTTAAAVIEELGDFLSKDDLVLDGGASEIGIESTIIDCTGEMPRVLRPGAITSEMVEETTGLKIQDHQKIEIRVSGSLESHYSPAAKVLLDQIPQSGQGFLALADIATPLGVIRLASPKSPEEFAKLLYSALRKADAQGLKEVVITQPLGEGISIAIRDRIVRSEKGRSDNKN